MFQEAVNNLESLFATERDKRNIERMSEKMDRNYQRQHHFLSDSPWSAQDLMQAMSRNTNKLLGNWAEQSYSIDESSYRKAGKHSVGVSHQYNGNLGKVENSQTGVYASLSRGNRVGLINCRLFLPDEWINDEARCKKAGVPRKAIVKKTKIDLALDMIRESIDAGVQFGWVNADGYIGRTMPGISVKWCHFERCCKVVKNIIYSFFNIPFLNDSPFRSILCEELTSLSNIASAIVPSPMISYQAETGI